MSSSDDDTLMAAYAQGEAAAFEQLYERHRQALYRFVRRLLGTAHSAQVDEVFQDTWLRVVQARARWQPQGASFRTWLFTLAHHRAIDCLRKSGREVSVDDGPAGDDSLTAAALVVYLSAASLVESAVAARAAHRSRADNTAQRDIAVWFHRPARLADWLLLDQRSDSAVGARALALGRVYNRDGELVATAGQEQYFPPVPPRRV